SLFKQWTSTATNSLTLTAWQTATAQDLNSLTSNPQYTSSSNLMPLSISPLRNAGMVISWVGSDINGTPRDNNPDIGAYEVVVAAGDIVALRMVSPAGNQLIAGQNYQISYRLLNGGGTALTSATLSYQWGSNPVVTNNFNGNVQPGDSITYTFTGPGITAPMVGSQTLKVWSSGPNSVADANPGNDTLSTAYCIPLSGTYTVGGTGSNFPTIDSALTYIGGCGISGPLTLSITPGTYTGSWNIGPYQGSSFGITVNSSTGNASDVVVSNPGNGNTIRLTNTSNISLYNLTISNPVLPSSGAVASACVEISNSSNITISNCILKGDPISTSSNNRSIYINTGTNLNISGNQIMNSYYGIYFSATSPDFNTNIQVVGNQFSNIYYYYLYLNRMSNLSVTANTFSNASGGFTPYYGFYVLASNGVAFRENQVYGTLNAYGWYFSSINGSASNPNMLVNNVFSCEFTSTTPRALYLTASTTDGLDYLELHHNSFEGRFLSSSTTANGLIYLTGGSATAPAMSRLIMRNNIFRLVRSSGTFSATGIYYFAGSYLIDSTLSNYNLFQFEGQGTSPLHRNASTNYNSLADWRTATGDDLNSIDGNPLFAGINNLTPSSLSPARNAGTPSFVTTDIAGNLRDANPDMGAYEIQLGAADVFVQNIVSPSGIVQPATTYPVTVRIINGSLNPLLNARLTYQLGNATPVTQNFTLSLQSGDTAQLTFSQNITSSPSATQTLVVWSSLPNGINDANPTNDTARTLLCQALSAGTYTVGNQGSANYTSFADLFEVLGCGGISGPVTILLDAVNNLWNEQVIVPFIPGAGPNNPLVIDAQGDTITSGSSVRSLATLSFNNSHNVIVRNAVIKATGTANGVLFVNADSCSLVANTIICDTTSTSSTVNAVVTSGALNSVSSNSVCNSLLIDSNLIVGGYYGMRIYGDANVYNANNTISNNRIQDFYVYGIYTYYQNGLGIIGNDVSRPNRSTTSTFYGNYNVYSLGGTFKNNKIHNGFDKNPTTTSTAYGLYIGSSPSTGSRPNLVYNNILYNFNTAGTIYGLYNSGNSNTDWYHNTAIFDHQATGTGAVYAVYFTGTGTNNDFKNNLVYVSRAGTGTKYGMYVPSTGAGLNSDNNNIAVVATAGTNNFGYNGSAIATLTAWRTASQNAWDMNSTDANPLFANTSSLPIVPTNWVMNNIGENLGSLVTTDLAGLTRSLTPDPGAYEYTVNGCFGLVNLRADNVQAYSARVLWASAASQWEVEYGLAGFAQGSGTFISLSQGNVILNNLLPNTAYQVYVREAGCSSGIGSWFTIGFTTKRDFDLSAVDLIAPFSGQCTNSSLPVRMVVANTGLLPMTGYTGRVRVSGPINATISASSSVVLAPGQKDTLLVGNLN
ncbi:MAG: beta strand repeat-containing protein, partial [Bacteroidota bacterium]